LYIISYNRKEAKQATAQKDQLRADKAKITKQRKNIVKKSEGAFAELNALNTTVSVILFLIEFY